MQPRMHLLEAERPSPALVYNRAYTCHQSVMKATDGSPALWVDLAGPTHAPLLRVLTAASLKIPNGWHLKDASDYRVNTIADGEAFAFRIRVNPSIKREGKRFAVWGDKPTDRESASQEWLVARGELHGFNIIDSKVLDIDWVKISRTAKQTKHPISFATATLTGRLSVEDASLFQQALIKGIGPQKAFGCGLMLVKRIRKGEE